MRSVLGELCPAPSMQFPMGPACIFLRKGIAEKQRVRPVAGTTGKGGQAGQGSWDVAERRHSGAKGGDGDGWAEEVQEKIQDGQTQGLMRLKA